jgi:hypothetical protein
MTGQRVHTLAIEVVDIQGHCPVYRVGDRFRISQCDGGPGRRRGTGDGGLGRRRRTGEHGPHLRSPVPRLRSKSKPMHVRRSDLPTALVWVPVGTCVEQGLREEVLL